MENPNINFQEIVDDIKLAPMSALAKKMAIKDLELQGYQPPIPKSIFGEPIIEEKSFTLKEMSKEEFEESEHPRDKTGKFTKKLGGSTSSNKVDSSPTIQEPKITIPKKHGGSRSGAGRLPSEAHKAVEALKEKIKKNNPELTDDQIKEKILERAKTENKPDWEEYINEPDKYVERKKREAIEIQKTRAGTTVSNGERISNTDNSTSTGKIKSQVKVSKKTFDEDVSLASNIKRVWDKYRNDELPESEKRWAGGVVAISAICAATAAYGFLRFHHTNLGSLKTYSLDNAKALIEREVYIASQFDSKNFKNLIPDWKSFPDDVKKQLEKQFKKTKFKIQQDSLIHHISDARAPNSLSIEVPSPTWTRLVKLGDYASGSLEGGPDFDSRLTGNIENYKGLLGKINKFVTKIAYRKEIAAIERVSGPSKHGYAIIKGEKLTGRFNLSRHKFMDRFPEKNGVRRAVEVSLADGILYDATSGIRITRKNNNGDFELDPIGIFNAKKMWKNFVQSDWIPGTPIKWKRGYEKQLDALGLSVVTNAEKTGYGIVVAPKITKPGSEARFESAFKALVANEPQENLLPRYLLREFTEDELKINLKGQGGYVGAEDFLNKVFIPSLNKKIFSSLVAFGGVSGSFAYELLRLANLPAEAYSDQQKKIDDANVDIDVAKLPKRTPQGRKRSSSLPKNKDADIIEAERKRAEKILEDSQKAADKSEEKDSDQEAGFHKKEFLDLIVKEINQNEINDFSIDIEEITDEMAKEYSQMICDISQSCKMVIDSGMPLHTKYEELLDIIHNMFLYMRDYGRVYEKYVEDQKEKGIPIT